MNNTKNIVIVVALVAFAAWNPMNWFKKEPVAVTTAIPVTTEKVPEVLGETKAVLPPRLVEVIGGVKTETISTASFTQEMEVSIDKALENNEYSFTLSGLEVDIASGKMVVTTNLETGSPIAGNPVITMNLGVKNKKDFTLLKAATIDANLVAYNMIKNESTKVPKKLFSILQNNRPGEPIATISLKNDEMILTFQE